MRSYANEERHIATQIMPVGDPKSLELFREFEKSIYAHKF